MAQTFSLDFDEEFCLMFFTDIQNTFEILGNVKDRVYPFKNLTVINSKLIIESSQVLVAANDAVRRKHCNNLITDYVHTELLYNLSLSNNIKDSLLEFACKSTDAKELLFAIFKPDPERIKSIQNLVLGNIQPLKLLREKCDLRAIRELYNITEEDIFSDFALGIIVSKMARKCL